MFLIDSIAVEIVFVMVFNSPEIDECEDDPCYPFGDCIDLIGDYKCQCKTGYEAVTNTTKLCTGKVIVSIQIFRYENE